jgi:hypothetical protein
MFAAIRRALSRVRVFTSAPEGDQADVTVVPDGHLKWIERLPLMHVDKHRIFVHAGKDFVPTRIG